MLRRKQAEEEGQLRRLEVDAGMSGTLVFKDPVNLQINGRFDGSLDVKGSLTIGPAAQVKATIHGESIIIGGTVEGPVVGTRRVELQARARLIGDVTTPRLIVHEEAILHGRCEMVPATPESAPEPETRQWMSLEELASYLEVEGPTVLEWAQSGRLPGEQQNDQWRFDRQKIEAWLAQEKIR